MESFDVVVLGAGSGGERLAGLLADAGRRVAVVESGRVGGECPYTACIPSKALLRSATARHDATRLVELGAVATAPVLDSAEAAWQAAVRRRDRLTEHLDDSAAAKSLQDKGITLVRGEGRVTQDGVVDVAGRALSYTDLVVATGSSPVVPDIAGLADIEPWTSDDGLTSSERPASLLVLGGGAIGCELAQVYARFGVEVVLVESGDQLLGKEEPRVAAAMAELLRSDGVDVRLGLSVTSFEPMARLDDGSTVEVARVLVATGRRPRTEAVAALGLERNDDGGIAVDAACRARDHVYAVGDVTALAPYTHAANYQADVVADVILGGDRRADLRAVPRCVYTDPPVASVGTLDAPHTVCVDLGDVPRTATDSERPGLLVLASDGEVLVGASAFGPRADEWLAEATLAIRARVPLAVLRDTIRPFPTVGEAYLPAVSDLIASART
ncbi:MAG: pyridine nucleotide-disulfide oxidoreductase dimerization region [Frankiales bacterium]|nr:pyridine nucleotide-disulfide oxidoreductase dimerization region [Frankiales bacterium]